MDQDLNVAAVSGTNVQLRNLRRLRLCNMRDFRVVETGKQGFRAGKSDEQSRYDNFVRFEHSLCQ